MKRYALYPNQFSETCVIRFLEQNKAIFVFVEHVTTRVHEASRIHGHHIIVDTLA